jgi:hypothetical protein
MNKSAAKLYARLQRLQPMAREPLAIRPLLTRAEIALILPALKAHYDLTLSEKGTE